MENNELWSKEEWDIMREKLESLSEEDLEYLVVVSGIKFEGGVKSVKDRPGFSRKEQLILVLDEVDRGDLLREYKELVEKNKKPECI